MRDPWLRDTSDKSAPISLYSLRAPFIANSTLMSSAFFMRTVPFASVALASIPHPKTTIFASTADVSVVVLVPGLGDEVQALKAYLEKGGRLLIMLEAFEDGGLKGFLAGYGVDLERVSDKQWVMGVDMLASARRKWCPSTSRAAMTTVTADDLVIGTTASAPELAG